ncbi:UDP-glucose 4-epimerase GalE [Roseiterribacter gracilis]|uniref:UDP-glucose 4-epimerase n=1 Tax=Roseiterribacter gracilis TaxID=2812848 RepID=A0A8S8X862_9PROT|nr:UDP-glucose 4-epimerase GalE [Rhodospirillales bacterium TMPK1]
MTVLVTGAAGYIGSHAVLALADAGHDVVAVDDLSAGTRDLIPAAVPFVQADIADEPTMGAILRDHRVRAVLHFAGSISVGESVRDPLRYYRNNVAGSAALLAACVDAGVRSLVFSSTAAVYGAPDVTPIPETAQLAPINPYGASKAMTERTLADVGAAHGLRWAALRYFNVAGADPQLRSGQAGGEVTHLIRRAVMAALGRASFAIHGDDYPTPDGTCVRDYVHVTDLVAAHLTVLDALAAGQSALTLNVGYGQGASVRDVVHAVERAAGHKLDAPIGRRRPGDPPTLVADSTRLRRDFGWTPRFEDLDTIVASALAWERKRGG